MWGTTAFNRQKVVQHPLLKQLIPRVHAEAVWVYLLPRFFQIESKNQD